MKIKNKILLIEYTSILLGFLFCIFIIWNRLIRERILRDLINDVNPYLINLYIFLFFLFLFLLLYTLKTLLKIETKNKYIMWFFEREIVIKTYSFIEKYIINSPKNFYEIIYNKITLKFYEILDNVCIFIDSSEISEKFFIKKSICLFFYSIKLIVSIIFIYDIIYYNQFIHFFKFLPFLIIPTIFNVILYVIFTYAERCKKAIEKWIIFTSNNKQDGFEFSLKEDYKNDIFFTDQLVEDNANLWYSFLITMMTIDEYYVVEKKYKSYFYLIIYSLYCFGWGYLLFNIFFK